MNALTGRKARIAQAFSTQAEQYDSAAAIQRQAATLLATRIAARRLRPAKILEIGCGTGFLSTHLAEQFPTSDLLLTDIAPNMLATCRTRLGDGPRYQWLDGEHPESLTEKFDLITSSLAFQWFTHLGAGLTRLTNLLTPTGTLIFATLGSATFTEWREAHEAHNLPCGTPTYPDAANFPFPHNTTHRLTTQTLTHAYPDARTFARSLKSLGAGEPAPGHTPLPAGAFRRLLASLEDGFLASYEVIIGEVRKQAVLF